MNLRLFLDSNVVRTLIGCNAVALIAAIYLLFAPVGGLVDVPMPADAEKIVLQQVKRPEPRISMDAFKERPLFHASRKPREIQRREVRDAAAAAVPAIVPPSKSYKLSGVVGTGASAQAYVSKTSSGETLRLKVGDIVDDWKVTGITRDQVSFSRDGAADQLSLR